MEEDIKQNTSSITFSANDIAWHTDIQLKARVRQSIVVATDSPDFSLDDALRILYEEIKWLESCIKNGKA